MKLRFKYYVDHFQDGYTLKVQLLIDGETSWEDPEWTVSPSSDIGPEIVNVGLSDYDDKIFQIAWVFEGDSGDINWWSIDDIEVYY